MTDRSADDRSEAAKGGLVDADRFLAFTQRLRQVRERVEDGDVDERRRAEWQRILVAISDAAKGDLDGADDKLIRLEAQLDRYIDT